LAATWRRKSSLPGASEEEVTEAELESADSEQEKAKAIAGASVLGVMAEYGGQAPAII
jgi:hypothetical protein